MTSTASALPTETKIFCVNADVKSPEEGTLGAPTTLNQPVASSTFLDRLLTVYYATLQREKTDRITYTEIARRVEGHTGIPVVQTTVTRWFTGSRPERELMVGLCKALGEGIPGGIDPGWLDYGDDSRAPAPSFRAEERRFLPPVKPEEAEAARVEMKKKTRRRRG